METLGKDLLGVLGRIEGAIKGEDAVKTTMRTRIKDYRSVLQKLQGSTSPQLQHEMERLQGLFRQVEDLHEQHTAGPEDTRSTKFVTRFNRGIKHESIAEELDAIDREVVRLFTAITAKSSTNSQAVVALLAALRPPPLPDMAAVPAGALALPCSFIERSGVRAAADGLLVPDKPLAPVVVVGMGGAGKTVLASSVVREQSVRAHFRGGIFWMRVGRGAKRSLLPLLQGLAREMGAAPTDASYVVPHVFDGLEHVQHHLVSVASAGGSPRLVVLDDVWEREVVDALLAVGLKLLVTTRDHSVVSVPGCCLELGDITEDEALELLTKMSMTVGQPGNDVRTQMMKVRSVACLLWRQSHARMLQSNGARSSSLSTNNELVLVDGFMPRRWAAYVVDTIISSLPKFVLTAPSLNFRTISDGPIISCLFMEALSLRRNPLNLHVQVLVVHLGIDM